MVDREQHGYMGEPTHRFVETNGIRMHVAEQGEGPPVLLCHGFPELWYSWRHQLSALAAAGFHAVAPDMRGYGMKAIPRPGVPQGKHPHGLLAGGLKALENLFPSFGNELMRAGAEPINPGFDVLNEVPGQDVWPKIKFSWSTYSMSRPLIERALRRQVERMRNIKVRGGSR